MCTVTTVEFKVEEDGYIKNKTISFLFNSILQTKSIKMRRMISDVECFSWRIAVSDMSSKQKMASLMFGFNRKQFLCLWSREDDYIGLGMVTRSSPTTIYSRYGLILRYYIRTPYTSYLEQDYYFNNYFTQWLRE